MTSKGTAGPTHRPGSCSDGPAPAPITRPDPAWFRRSGGEDASTGIHGVDHVTRVTVHAVELALALGLPPWQVEAARLAALWHDIGRERDGADFHHGARSAGKVLGLGLHAGVAPPVLELALLAVTFHAGDDRWGEAEARRLPDPEAALAVFRVLKDADALDRVRFGRSGLDARLLRLEASRRRIRRAVELLDGQDRRESC